jgi:ABC-type antimicrobial peptide transport system permease subunit
MGIRLALGSTPGGVIGLVLSRAGMLVGLGIAIGGVASYWAASFVAALTYGVAPRDWPTLASAAAILALVGVLAAWLPARRASRLDPAQVLREG